MKNLIFALLSMVLLIGCGKGFQADFRDPGQIASPDEGQPVTLFAISNAIVNVHAIGDIAALQRKRPTYATLLLPQALADVTQASGVVSVTYSNPGATSFTLNTTGFMAGAYPSVSGTDLNLGTIAVSALDDNSLRVCTGVGAPANKCNRLYIRVFTLGSNIANTITSIAGFINTDAASPYGIDVLAGAVLTPIGYNVSANANTVVNAAQVFTYTIGNGMNRVRLSDTGAISFPLKASLANAGAGSYEMRLVVQYALGYVP